MRDIRKEYLIIHIYPNTRTTLELHPIKSNFKFFNYSIEELNGKHFLIKTVINFNVIWENLTYYKNGLDVD